MKWKWLMLGVLALLAVGGSILWPKVKQLRLLAQRRALSFDCAEYPLLCNFCRAHFQATLQPDGRIRLDLASYYDGATQRNSGLILADWRVTPAKVIPFPAFERPEVYGVREMPPELRQSSLWRNMRPQFSREKLRYRNELGQMSFLGPTVINLEDSPMCLPFVQQGSELTAYACGRTFHPYRNPKLEVGLIPLEQNIKLEECNAEWLSVQKGEYSLLENKTDLSIYADGLLVSPGFACYLVRDESVKFTEGLVLWNRDFCQWDTSVSPQQIQTYYLFWNPLLAPGTTSLDHPPATP